MFYQNIETLCTLPGVSGCEDQVRDEIINQIKDHCTYHIDPLGNLLAFKKGKKAPKQTMMLSAHMDEVGLIVTYAEESGLLRFSIVGGIDKRIIVGKSVQIGDVYGVIGCKAIHMKTAEEKEKALGLDSLYIDIGAKDRDQALEMVALGDRAVFTSQYSDMGDGFLRGRALDDRAGCAMMIELIQGELEYDTWFAFTVQEETGTTGGKTAAAHIKPGIAIAVETTTACDIPGVTDDKVVCRLGKGPVISFMDRGTIYDMDLYKRAMAVAKEKEILCQTKAGVYGGNESRSVQVAGDGARVLAVSIPCRYLHTPSCVAYKTDIDEMLKLLKELIVNFGE